MISGTHWVSSEVERRGVGAASRAKDGEEKGAGKAAAAGRVSASVRRPPLPPRAEGAGFRCVCH